LGEDEMVALADVIADVLLACTPYSLEGRKGDLRRAKVDFAVLEEAKLLSRTLAEKAGIDYEPGKTGYPHFYYLDDYDSAPGEAVAFDILGDNVREFLNFAASSDVEALEAGQSQPTRLYTPAGEVEGTLACLDAEAFRLRVPGGRPAGLAAAWLRSLSDGYAAFDGDLQRKLPGPVIVRESAAGEGPLPTSEGTAVAGRKPYFVGLETLGTAGEEFEALPRFNWNGEEGELRRTPLYETHHQLGAKIIPFAGWEMPVWYTSVVDEHLAVRKAAGLFDVAHMGVYQAEGPDASAFLDSVTGNDIAGLGVGESLYTHFLDPHADVIDDLLVYRRGPEKYLVVVNASNDDKDWTWLNAVRDGQVQVDEQRPWTRAYGRAVILRNLRDPAEGAGMRVDIALQGPRSRDILLAIGVDEENRERILALKRTQLCEAVAGGFDLVVSRTGYTGEKMAFELFVHPDQADALFKALLAAGEPFGLKPCGLGARDSLRTEAGLPLYGHEMGTGSNQRGDRDLGVAEGGFGSYVKAYKPWFIGRQAYLEREAARKGVVARFRFNEKGVRMAHGGDPVADRRGRVIGWVTSCAVDSQGFLTGLAYLESKGAEEGTPILIYQGAPGSAGKAPAEMLPGDRAVLPTPATVISRFPKS
jgi:glycine hydroxymethyltransferase